MNKQEFINDSDVKTFISFLADSWKGGFDFNVGIKGEGAQQAEYKQISSLKQAYEQYLLEYSIKTSLRLPNEIALQGSSLADGEAVLAYCKDKLMAEGALNLTDKDIREASELVLKLGGAFRDANKDKVEDRTFDLVKIYQNAIKEWQDINQNSRPFFAENELSFPSNSGFTKIYTLILTDFVNYDSRIATALAYLIDTCFNSEIPSALVLAMPPYRKAANNKPDKRKVNGIFRPTENKDSRKHFESNVKASLVLSEVLKVIQQEDPSANLRQLEAALFMVGYDVRNQQN
jgi:hypothetical protein